MGFKSHMMATMAKWRERDYLTDTTFQCYDGQVSAHRFVVKSSKLHRSMVLVVLAVF